MNEKQTVMVLQGDVELETLSNTTYPWYDPDSREREIQFREGYSIERIHWDEGIQDCVYQINGRIFTDLSFAKGETLAEYPDHYEIRRHADGTKFLFFYSSIPTFDEGDWLWDHISHLVVYYDGNEVILISCRHGAKIPRIKVYIGLEKSNSNFDRWLTLLKNA